MNQVDKLELYIKVAKSQKLVLIFVPSSRKGLKSVSVNFFLFSVYIIYKLSNSATLFIFMKMGQ